MAASSFLAKIPSPIPSFPELKENVSQLEKIRRQQLIRQAEGYLDLLTCLDECWPPEMEVVELISGKALHSLDRLDVRSGRRGYAAFLRGRAFQLRCDFESGVTAFTEALEYESDNMKNRLGLARCYRGLNNLVLAIETLEEGVRSQPSHVSANYCLACYWALIGNVSQSCDYLFKAIELEPEIRERIELEPDFDSVREFSEFQMAVAVVV